MDDDPKKLGGGGIFAGKFGGIAKFFLFPSKGAVLARHKRSMSETDLPKLFMDCNLSSHRDFSIVVFKIISRFTSGFAQNKIL